jgi:F-type H+/Na+-transporting ATPase subunit alpha
MFQLHTGEPLVKVGKESVEAMADEEIDQEKIVRQKR